MFEIIVLIYLAVFLGYGVAVKKWADSTQKELDMTTLLGIPLIRLLPGLLRCKLLSEEERLNLGKLAPVNEIEKSTDHYVAGKLGVVFLVLVAGGFISLIVGHDYSPKEIIEDKIEKPSYGIETEEMLLEYEIVVGEQEVTGQMPLSFQEVMPVKEEAQEILQERMTQLPTYMLQEGDSIDRVTRGLSFEAYPFEDQVAVSYQVFTPEIMTDKGALIPLNMTIGEQYPIAIKVQLEIGDSSIEGVLNFEALRQPMSLEEEAGALAQRIQEDESKVQLPVELLEGEGQILWFRPASGIQGQKVFAVFVLLAVLALITRKRQLETALAIRQQQIRSDFPDVVGKLTMLINGGMTFQRAWMKVVADYQSRHVSKRPLYEEMITATHQIENGMPMREVLERFGQRTGNKEIIRMTGILIQNVRLGGSSLADALKQLSIEAWDVRINNARIQGEKASTKLLLPMGISFITVILIVLAPTMMTLSQ